MSSVVAVTRARRERPLGWWGMAMFVAAEATLLAVMVATYFYLRFKNLQWPPRGVPLSDTFWNSFPFTLWIP